MIKLQMKNYNTTITKNPGKTSALSSGKIDKYEYLTSEQSDPKKSSSKLYRNFLNEIANDETNINTEIFNQCCKHQNSS